MARTKKTTFFRGFFFFTFFSWWRYHMKRWMVIHAFSHPPSETKEDKEAIKTQLYTLSERSTVHNGFIREYSFIL